MQISIRAAESKEDLASIAQLFQAYAQWLNIDLSFQHFTSEISDLPGQYASPKGALYLVEDANGKAVGCVALRPLLSDKICEMKRLYVLPEARGTGAGKMLASTVIATASSIGYEKIRLDTLPHMTSAISLYKTLGFAEIEAYYATPLADTVFLEMNLIPD